MVIATYSAQVIQFVFKKALGLIHVIQIFVTAALTSYANQFLHN